MNELFISDNGNPFSESKLADEFNISLDKPKRVVHKFAMVEVVKQVVVLAILIKHGKYVRYAKNNEDNAIEAIEKYTKTEINKDSAPTVLKARRVAAEELLKWLDENNLKIAPK